MFVMLIKTNFFKEILSISSKKVVDILILRKDFIIENGKFMKVTILKPTVFC